MQHETPTSDGVLLLQRVRGCENAYHKGGGGAVVNKRKARMYPIAVR
jgi:hypothetical protein